MKTRKQLRKETIMFCKTFGSDRKLSKKDIKYYMKFHIFRECEEILETNGIKVVKEPTLKELSFYKKKAKEIKFSSKEKKVLKMYFKNKKKSAKEFANLCKVLKKLNMTLEEFDRTPLVEIDTDGKSEDVKAEIVEEVKVEIVEEVKAEIVEEVKVAEN